MTETGAPPKEIYATYTGAGVNGYLMGLPACDMTLAEWDACDPALLDRALALKLYTLAGAPAEPVAPASQGNEP